MLRMNHPLSLALALSGLLLAQAAAAPEFAPVLQSGMVVQREEPVTLWGTARGRKVTVSWKGQRATAPVNKGKWKVTLPPAAADAQPSRITAQDSTGSTTLENILVGDVWLASGQSNMEWTLAQSAPLPAEIRPENPQVRVLRGHGLLHGLPGTYSEELYRKAAACGGYSWEWRACTPTTTRDCSALATLFAVMLQEREQVPIGVICNAKGGSSMEAWIPRSLINKKKLYAPLRGDKWLEAAAFDAWSRGRARQNLAPMLARGEKNLRHPFAPGYQYEVAVEPLRHLAIRGVIWYQGESNADTPEVELNAAKLKDLIRVWRQRFRKEKLPFLMVQLPRINDPKRPWWPEFREAQQQVADELEGVGLACTIDLGSTDANVHPPQKAPVARRLVDLALHLAYGREGTPTYPRITRADADSGRLRLHLSQTVTTADGKAPRGFMVGNPKDPTSYAPVQADLAPGGEVIYLPLPGRGQNWRYLHTTAADPNLVGAEGKLPLLPARAETCELKR